MKIEMLIWIRSEWFSWLILLEDVSNVFQSLFKKKICFITKRQVSVFNNTEIFFLNHISHWKHQYIQQKIVTRRRHFVLLLCAIEEKGEKYLLDPPPWFWLLDIRTNKLCKTCVRILNLSLSVKKQITLCYLHVTFHTDMRFSKTLIICDTYRCGIYWKTYLALLSSRGWYPPG